MHLWIFTCFHSRMEIIELYLEMAVLEHLVLQLHIAVYVVALIPYMCVNVLSILVHIIFTSHTKVRTLLCPLVTHRQRERAGGDWHTQKGCVLQLQNHNLITLIAGYVREQQATCLPLTPATSTVCSLNPAFHCSIHRLNYREWSLLSYYTVCYGYHTQINTHTQYTNGGIFLMAKETLNI